MAAKAPLEFVTAFGRYTARATDLLGQGGSGRVYRATDEQGNAVAVKVLEPGTATKEKARRFKNEILFGATARHAHVVPVLDSGSIRLRNGDASFYVMPLYPATLRQRIEAGIPPGEVLRLFGGLLDGVEAAHMQGVVHRDLKPENVLVDGAGALVVADFGVAHFEDEERFTAVETRPGTRLANFQYAAPEQRVRGRAVDRRADLYALGLMLNEMLTGEVPHGTGYRAVADAAPEHAFVDEVVTALIQQSPAARPASIDVLKQQLHLAGQAFITRQKLNELQNTVVPASTVVDPLLDDPIRVIGFDVPAPNTVTLMLNRAPSAKWKEAMQRVNGYRYYEGSDPRRMPINGTTIKVQATADILQQVINTYKEFIALTNDAYPRLLADEARSRDEQERRQRQAQIEAERQRLELLKSITI